MSAQLKPITLGGHYTLPLLTLAESPTNPRTVFDGLDELAASIKAQGVIEPIVVRPDGDGAYEIVAGARRFRAAQLAGLKDIPAVVRDYDDAQVFEVQIVENLQRQDITPLDEARGFKRLVDGLDLSPQAIADRLGKSVEYVYARLKLLNATPKVQQALADGKLKAEQAVLLARLPEKDQAIGLGKCTESYHPMTVRDLRRWVQERDDNHKTQQRVQGEISRAKAAGEKVVEVCASAYDAPPKGTLKPGQYVEAGKAKCDHLARAFAIDWTGNGREWLYTGKSFKACTSPATCAAHKPKKQAASYAERDSRHIAKTGRSLAEERRRKARAKAEDIAIAAILGKVRKLGATELDTVFAALLNRLQHEDVKAVCRRHQWEPKKRQYGSGDYDGAILEQYQQRNAASRGRLLLELALQNHTSLFGTDRGLVKIARGYRVDVVKLERKALAEMNAKKKATKKAATKKSTKKAKGAKRRANS